MTPEEAVALVNQGAAIDAAAGQEAAQAAEIVPAGGLVPAEPQNAASEWLFVPELLAMVICVALPEAAPAYTDEANMRFAEKLAAVAEKRGWNGMSSSPEIGLGLAAIGFGMPAFMAYKSRQAAAAQAEQAGATLNGKPVINGGTDGDGQ